MNRRVFLGAIGSATSIGALSYATRDPVDVLEVTFWLSERASGYRSVPQRVDEYLALALDVGVWQLDLEYGGIVDVSTENGAAVTRDGEWPRRLAKGSVGLRDQSVARHVNLLVTDGQMETTPTGYGMPHVASVGGARSIETLEPIQHASESNPVDGTQPLVCAYTTPFRVMQVLIHEVGHALGLTHEHGVAYSHEDAVVSTPMISTYAYDEAYGQTRSRCGDVYPATTTTADSRKLQLTYSPCSIDRLASYRGGFVP